jgi:hypothetical protein
MNSAHAHLLINHLPIFGNILGVVLLALAMMRKKRLMLTAGLIAFVVAAVSTIPTFASGYIAGPSVAALEGVTRGAVQEHLDAAIWSLVATLIVGILSGIALYLGRRSEVAARRWTVTAFVIGVLAALLAMRAGNTGGAIRHPEATAATAFGFEVGRCRERGLDVVAGPSCKLQAVEGQGHSHSTSRVPWLRFALTAVAAHRSSPRAGKSQP